MTTTALRLGWIALDSMGLAMALNLQKHLVKNGFPALCYYNLIMSRGDQLKAIGGILFSDILDVLKHSDIIFISLGGDTALTETIQNITSLGSLRGKIFVDTTTVHPDTSKHVTDVLNQHSATYIAAPVFGAAPVSQAGKLVMVLAGPKDTISTILPFVHGVLARRVILASPDPSKALLLKATSNYLTAGLMYLISEAHVLVEKSGLPASVLEALIETNFGAYAGGVSKRMTNGEYLPAEGEEPFSGLDDGIKDVGVGVKIARDVGVELRVGELCLGAMEEAKTEGDKRVRWLDSSAVYGVVRKRAGLAFENEVVRARDEMAREAKERWIGEVNRARDEMMMMMGEERWIGEVARARYEMMMMMRAKERWVGEVARARYEMMMMMRAKERWVGE